MRRTTRVSGVWWKIGVVSCGLGFRPGLAQPAAAVSAASPSPAPQASAQTAPPKAAPAASASTPSNPSTGSDKTAPPPSTHVPTPVVRQPSGAAFPAPAPATSSTQDEPRVRTLLAEHPEFACNYLAHWSLKMEVLIACGSAGVLRAQRSGEKLIPSGMQRVAGEAFGFFEQAGQVWVRTRMEQAVAIASATDSLGGQTVASPSTDVAPSPPAAPPIQPTPTVRKKKRKKQSGRKAVLTTVIERRDLDVLVDAGSDDGLTLNRHVAFDKPNKSEAKQLLADDRDDNQLIVGRVVELWDNKARVRIGVNENVELGTPARSTQQRLTASRRSPPRVYDHMEVKVLGRPVLNLGQIGGGILADARVSWRTENFHYGVAASPVGIASSDEEGTTAPWSVYAFGTFDGQNFEAGLGLGGQSVNDTSRESESGSATSLVQFLRLGSVDGLHVQSRTQVAIFRSETLFSTMQVEGQLAVSGNSWLLLRGGGGTVGYGFGEVALRNLLSGNGGKDSFFLEVGIGGAAAFEEHCLNQSANVLDSSLICEDRLIGGPMIALGGEWRM